MPQATPRSAFAAICLCLGAAWWVLAPAPTMAQERTLEDFALADVPFGGDFRLTDHTGQTRALSELAGNVIVMFFGYTSCPDICPVTLVDVARALREMPEGAGAARGVFVTLDPERDTVDKLRAYVGHFHENIVGMTGSQDEVGAVAALYGARFQIVDSDSEGGYTVAHTGYLYLLDPAGRVRYVLPYDAGPALIREGIETLLEAS